MFIGLSTLALGEEIIRLTTTEYAPFTSESLRYNGVVNRIITESFALEGVRVIYDYFPAKRALQHAKKEGWVGSSYWYKTPEREKYFLFSDVVKNATFSFFHKKAFPFNWNKLEDLENINIGGTTGYFYNGIF